MKGIVFTEFLEFVESHHSYELVDQIIEEAQVPSGGVYTAVGSYPFEEMLSLMKAYCGNTGQSPSDILRQFGNHLFSVFYKSYHYFFTHANNAFEFLISIDTYIHIEVQKLYPDAELPKFTSNRISENILELHYSSPRRLGELAYGLLESALIHFKETATIAMTHLDDDGSEVKFIITRL